MADRAIVCGSTVCPICGGASEVLIGPCADCDEHFAKHRKWPRRKRGALGGLKP